MSFNLISDVLALDDYERFCIHHLDFKPYPEQIEIASKFDSDSHLLVLIM